MQRQWRTTARVTALVVGSMTAGAVSGGVAMGAEAPDAKGLIDTLLVHEQESWQHRGHYIYESEERSERTAGHLWRERVAETNWGKVRFLIAEDGQALSGARLASEKARVEDEGANPEEFKRKEAAKADDEAHAKSLLTLLPKAFLFDGLQAEGSSWRVHFRPNPGYSPHGLEEEVLHGMQGSVLVDQKTIRMRELDGQVPQDISIGFGLLATIKAGSNFETVREPHEGMDWKTQTLHTDFKGKALFLKTIARQQDSKHWGFRRISDGMTVADAVTELERPVSDSTEPRHAGTE